jgi:hypothetical protein
MGRFGRLLASCGAHACSSDALIPFRDMQFRQSLPAAWVVQVPVTRKIEAKVRVFRRTQLIRMKHVINCLTIAPQPTCSCARAHPRPSIACNRYIPIPIQRKHTIGLWVAQQHGAHSQRKIYSTSSL